MSVPVRTDTTLLGPCDGRMCWVLASSSYPPTSSDLWILTYANNQAVLAKLYGDNTTSLNFNGLGVPACVQPYTRSVSSGEAATLLFQIYTSPLNSPTDNSYVGNLTSNGLTLTSTDTLTLQAQTPSRWTSNVIMSSVGYVFNGTIDAYACSNPNSQNCYSQGATAPNTLSQCYFYFFPGITFSSDMTIPGADINWLNQYRTATSPSTTFVVPYQASAFMNRLNGTMGASNGFTDPSTVQQYGSVGMVFYSSGACGASVQFTGLDGTPQSGSTSVGTCNSGNCALTDGQFQCPSGGGQPPPPPPPQTNSLWGWIVFLGVVIAVIVIVAVVVALASSGKDDDDGDDNDSDDD